MITRSEEDYLRTIYEVSTEFGEVHSVEVARRLEVSKPSVSKTLKILEGGGYIEPIHYGPIKLTDRGRSEGRRLHERYRSIKRFLVEVLGVDEDTAKREAHGIEHSISYDTAFRLESYCKDKLQHQQA